MGPRRCAMHRRGRQRFTTDQDVGAVILTGRRQPRVLRGSGPRGSARLRRRPGRSLDPRMGNLLRRAALVAEAAGHCAERHGGGIRVPGRAAGRHPRRASRRSHGPAGDQCRHRQHHRAVAHARDAGPVAHDRAHAHGPHDGRRGMPSPRAHPPSGRCRLRSCARRGRSRASSPAKPPIAMRLNKQRFRAVTEPGFRDAIAAGIPSSASRTRPASRRGWWKRSSASAPRASRRAPAR